VKILAVFALVLALNRLRLQMSLSLLIGSIALGLWVGMGPLSWLEVALASVVQPQSISLALIVTLILIMSRLMKEAGHMDRVVATLTHLSRDPRIAGPFLAALIGLLPMPGGALFSAPMVETSLAESTATGESKALVNYWFRHIWEFWWPLYPGVVLAVALVETHLWQYMAAAAPACLISAAAGYLFIVKPIGKIGNAPSSTLSWAAFKAFLYETMPILIVVLVILFFSGVMALLDLLGHPIRIYGAFSILPGLLAAIGWVCKVNHVSRPLLRSSLLDRGILPMLGLVLSIMVFKGIMIEGQAVAHVQNELAAYNIPVLVLIAAMPFLSGLITGIAIGFVGASFPLVMPLFPSHLPFDMSTTAALAYTFGFMGMMLSPVHLCLLVSRDYYRADLVRLYRSLVLPVLSVMGRTLGLYLVSRVL